MIIEGWLPTRISIFGIHNIVSRDNVWKLIWMPRVGFKPQICELTGLVRDAERRFKRWQGGNYWVHQRCLGFLAEFRWRRKATRSWTSFAWTAGEASRPSGSNGSGHHRTFGHESGSIGQRHRSGTDTRWWKDDACWPRRGAKRWGDLILRWKIEKSFVDMFLFWHHFWHRVFAGGVGANSRFKNSPASGM